MGSIPLPALQVKPAEDPLTGYAKALSIRSAQNENQIQQQQIQGQQIQNQQQQMSLDSQKAIMRAYTETNGDLGKAIPLAAKYGAKPADLATVQSGYIQQQEAALKLSDAKRARALQDADLVKGAHDQVSALPPEQRPAAYQQALAGLKNSGVDISQMPPQYPGDEAFQFSGAAIQGHKQLLQEAETIAATQKSNAQAAEANASIPGKQAQGEQQIRANAASQLASSKDQADYEARRGQLPFAVAKAFPDQFDKDAVLAAGQTPHEQVMARNPTEASLAVQAVKGDQTANAALGKLVEQKKAARPIVNNNGGGTSDDPKDIAKGIMSGNLPPTTKGLYRNAAPVQAELARQGFNLQAAESDWNAVQKHLATLNGAQQERLRQAVTFTYDSLDNIENLYNEWKQAAPQSGFKIFNKATLAASKQVPGKAGATAQALEAQINDLTSELGTVYKGGNASTDETLRLAAENLRANWNEETFRKGLQQIRTNLGIRKNSILNSQPAGVRDNSPYTPKGGGDSSGTAQHTPGAKAGLQEGATGKGSDGNNYVVKGGVWVRQ